MMDKKTVKTPTEPIRLDDVWNGFKTEYLPFVQWMRNPDTEDDWIDCQFLENAPTPYTNKWNREQFKIRINDPINEAILSAGKKLFTKILQFCKSENKLPMDLGVVRIIRYGSGFETDYKIGYPKT